MANSLDRPSITADGDFSKSGAQHVDEALSKSVEDYAIATPESLRDMTDDDLQKLETKMVRKVDFVILYVSPPLTHPGPVEETWDKC